MSSFMLLAALKSGASAQEVRPDDAPSPGNADRQAGVNAPGRAACGNRFARPARICSAATTDTTTDPTLARGRAGRPPRY
jgi:hypothetical protein